MGGRGWRGRSIGTDLTEGSHTVFGNLTRDEEERPRERTVRVDERRPSGPPRGEIGTSITCADRSSTCSGKKTPTSATGSRRRCKNSSLARASVRRCPNTRQQKSVTYRTNLSIGDPQVPMRPFRPPSAEYLGETLSHDTIPQHLYHNRHSLSTLAPGPNRCRRTRYERDTFCRCLFQGHRDGPEAFQRSFPLLEVSRRPADPLTEEHTVFIHSQVRLLL